MLPSAKTEQRPLAFILQPSGLKEASVDRQSADAFAGDGEDRIRYRWRDDGARRFAESTRSLRALDDMRLDDRSFVDSHRPVVIEIALLNAPALQRDSAVQRGS